MTDPYVTIEYVDASYAHVGYETFRPGVNILTLSPAYASYYFFHHRLTVPAGAVPANTTGATDVAPGRSRPTPSTPTQQPRVAPPRHLRSPRFGVP